MFFDQWINSRICNTVHSQIILWTKFWSNLYGKNILTIYISLKYLFFASSFLFSYCIQFCMNLLKYVMLFTTNMIIDTNAIIKWQLYKTCILYMFASDTFIRCTFHTLACQWKYFHTIHLSFTKVDLSYNVIAYRVMEYYNIYIQY